MRSLWLGVAFLLTCMMHPSDALATEVSGTVDLSTVKSAHQPDTHRAYYWEEPNGALPPKSGTARAHQEVCLVVLGKGRPEAPRYSFEGGTLAPRTLALRSGSKATIVNSDIFSHQLFSPELNDLEPLATAPGHMRKVTLGKVGVYSLRDRMHPSVTGHAHVIGNLLQQVPLRPDGSFEFEIDPGTYRIKVLRGTEVVLEKPIKVSGRKTNVGRLKLKSVKK